MKNEMKNEMKTIIEYLLLQQKLYVNTYKYNLATNHYVLLKNNHRNRSRDAFAKCFTYSFFIYYK